MSYRNDAVMNHPLAVRVGRIQVARIGAMMMLGLLSACTTLRRPGFPRQSYNQKQQIKNLEKVFDTAAMIRDYYDMTKTPPEQETAARNRIISGRLALIDLHYNAFVADSAFEKQSLDTAAELTELGVNLATTAVGGAGAKTVLGAISAGVTGGKVAVDKNFFYEKTVSVIVTSMDAGRKTVLVQILQGLQTPASEYPLAQALSDVDAYYFAGTFLGALQSIQSDAGAKQTRAEVQLKTIRERGFVEEERQDRVGKLLDQIDDLSDMQALGLEARLPVREEETDKVIAARDPTGQRFKHGKAAREALKTRVIMSKRSDADLDAWEAAVGAIK
jgi:hypothetical protein